MKIRYAIYLLIPACLFLGACFRSTPTNYYLLESTANSIQEDNLPARSLRVAQVEVPSYLNRNNIVSRVQGQTKLILAEFHLWAEPVSSGVRRVVEDVLFKPMLAEGINVLPTGTESGGDYVLLLDVQRLDGNFNENAVLDCRWTLLDKNERPLERGIFSAQEMVNGADYNILVGAESSLVRKLGTHLAQRLPQVIKNVRRYDRDDR